MPRRIPPRRGVTLVEIIVAMTLTLAVFAITLPFVRVQTRALGANAGRLDAEQIARYAQRAIDSELRLADADSGQPLIVYAGPMGISFNVNLLAIDTTDPGALAVNPGADSSATEAWRVADAAPIPLTARNYPPVDYTDADGAPSRKETVSYFLHPDTVTGRSDIYVLYRRVNARDSVQVVRGVHVPGDSAFFSYLQMSGGTLVPIVSSALPLYWDSSATPTIRAVGLRSAGFFRNQQSGEDVIRTIYWMSVLPNSKTVSTTACATVPAAPTGVARQKIAAIDPGGSSTSKYLLRVTWSASSDDASDGTVRAYAIERRIGGVWRVVQVVPASADISYRFEESMPLVSGSVLYGVSALTCTGVSSTRATAPSSVTLP